MIAILLVATALGAEIAPLACNAPVADRGVARGGPTLEHTFTVVNRSRQIITILDARGSCGCLSPKISKHHLEPGAGAEIVVAVATATQPDGPNQWKIAVRYRTSGAVEETLELQLKATLVREVGLSPAALQLIGAPGTTHFVMLTDRRPKPLQLTAVQASSERLRTKAEAWEKAADGWRCRIRVQLAADCPAGAWDETIILVGEEADYRELRLPVRIVCRGSQRVHASPDQVQLRWTAGKPAASVLVLLRDAKGESVQIEKVECADDGLVGRFAEGAHATAAVRISIVSGKTPQPRSTVTIHVRAPAAEVLTIPVEVAQAP